MYQKQVSFGEAISMALNKYCCFTGRASRSEFWWFYLFILILSSASSLLPGDNALYVSGAVTLVLFLPMLGLTWRRLHDIGKGGGWYFLGLIPIVGQIILIIWFCKNSELQPNRFGDVPNLVQA